MRRDKGKIETVFKYWDFKKTIKKIKRHNILWTIPLCKPLLILKIIKKRLKFCKDHQYEEYLRNGSLLMKLIIGLKFPEKINRLWKERTIFNPKRGIKEITVIEHSVNIKSTV